MMVIKYRNQNSNHDNTRERERERRAEERERSKENRERKKEGRILMTITQVYCQPECFITSWSRTATHLVNSDLVNAHFLMTTFSA